MHTKSKVTGPFVHFCYSIPFYFVHIFAIGLYAAAEDFEMQTGNLNIEITDLWLIISSCWQEQNRSLAIKYQRDFPGPRHRTRHIHAFRLFVCLPACPAAFLFCFIQSIKFNVTFHISHTATPPTHFSIDIIWFFHCHFSVRCSQLQSTSYCNQHRIAITVHERFQHEPIESLRAVLCSLAVFGFVFSFICVMRIVDFLFLSHTLTHNCPSSVAFTYCHLPFAGASFIPMVAQSRALSHLFAGIQISLRSRSLLYIIMGLLHVFSWYRSTPARPLHRLFVRLQPSPIVYIKLYMFAMVILFWVSI